MKNANWKLSIAKYKSTLSAVGSAKLFFIFHFLIFIFQFPNLVRAQVGTCEPAMAEAFLDAGNVRASIYNNGGLFWRGGAPVYEVPKDEGVSAIFAAGIWVGGLIEGEVRTAAARYGNWEFWAGPLDEDANPPADCTRFDKIWEIRKEDLAAFLDEDIISENLRNWPWQLGAPVVDGDGDLHNYNLPGGDLPELIGDQRLWWIMNDRGNAHLETESEPMGLEVQAMAHVFDQPGFIRNVTFYNYLLINKNTSDLTEAYFAFWNDVDLGNFDDDYAGSDSLLHLGYVYNADNDDKRGYGIAPPALGLTFLKTAEAPVDGLDNDRDGIIDEPGEMIGATGFMFYNSDGSLTGDPSIAQSYYYYLQSRWKDGRPITFGGTGIDYSNIPVRFMFPGDPVIKEGWTEFTPDPVRGAIPPNAPADRRSLISSGPFTIASNDTLNIRFAVAWSRGNSNLDSVTALKRDVGTLHVRPETYYQQSTFELPQEPAPPVFNLRFDTNFPNPFAGSTTLRYSLPQTMQVRLAVYDLLGREIEVLVDQQQNTGIYTIEFEAGTQPSGIYMARIDLDHLRFTKRMVLAR